MLGLCFSIMQADRLMVQTLACKTTSAFEKLDDKIFSDTLALQRFANEHGCVILSPSDNIEVLAEEGIDGQSRFVTIIVKGTGEQYKVFRRTVQIEQPGRKNRFSF
jgi:hypothetical protein